MKLNTICNLNCTTNNKPKNLTFGLLRFKRRFFKSIFQPWSKTTRFYFQFLFELGMGRYAL